MKIVALPKQQLDPPFCAHSGTLWHIFVAENENSLNSDFAIGNEYFVFMGSDWENCDLRANRDTGRVQSGLRFELAVGLRQWVSNSYLLSLYRNGNMLCYVMSCFPTQIYVDDGLSTEKLK